MDLKFINNEFSSSNISFTEDLLKNCEECLRISQSLPTGGNYALLSNSSSIRNSICEVNALANSCCSSIAKLLDCNDSEIQNCAIKNINSINRKESTATTINQPILNNEIWKNNLVLRHENHKHQQEDQFIFYKSFLNEEEQSENWKIVENNLFQIHKYKVHKDIENTELIYIDNSDALEKYIDEISTYSLIALDVEHYDMKFDGVTCLIQISTIDKDYIIDPLYIFDKLYMLNKFTNNPYIIKILHTVDSDVLWLNRDFNIYLVNIFDIRIGHCVINTPGRMSLKSIINVYLNIELDKTCQLSDWRVRPLTSEQLTYARSDTHYLISIFQLMRNQILAHPGYFCLDENVFSGKNLNISYRGLLSMKGLMKNGLEICRNFKVHNEHDELEQKIISWRLKLFDKFPKLNSLEEIISNDEIKNLILKKYSRLQFMKLLSERVGDNLLVTEFCDDINHIFNISIVSVPLKRQFISTNINMPPIMRMINTSKFKSITRLEIALFNIGQTQVKINQNQVSESWLKAYKELTHLNNIVEVNNFYEEEIVDDQLQKEIIEKKVDDDTTCTKFKIKRNKKRKQQKHEKVQHSKKVKKKTGGLLIFE